MELQVYGQNGEASGRSVELDETVFGIEPNEHVVWLDVRRIQAAARQGTHKTKERGENSHSTRKLYRQKGTGYSRAGSAKSPIRKTGGRTHGARPRDYDFKVNRKTQRLARRSVLSDKARNDALHVIEDVQMEAPSTRQFIDLIGKLGLDGRKVLLLTAEPSTVVYRSSRNVSKLNVQAAEYASTLDLLDAQAIILQEGALDVLSRTLGTADSAATAA